MTLLTINIEKIGLKDAGQCIDPYITVSVKGNDFSSWLLASSWERVWFCESCIDFSTCWEKYVLVLAFCIVDLRLPLESRVGIFCI